MSKLVQYRVARDHQGDLITDDGSKVHLFREGDTRLAHPGVVAQLVKSGVLIAPSDEKAEAEPDNKSEGDAPSNKSKGNAPSNKSGVKPKK